MAFSSPRTDAILALRAQGMTIREIAAAVPCAERTVLRTLAAHGLSRPRSQTRSSTLRVASPPARYTAGAQRETEGWRRQTEGCRRQTDEWTPDAVADLRRQGLSHRTIANLTGLSRSQVGLALVHARMRWRHEPKRQHEAAILALVAETLSPIAHQGAAIALTGPEVAIHVDALRHVVSRLIVPERDPVVYHHAVAALAEPPAIPVDLVLGDFWNVAAGTDHPIAFLDYDGMGTLPEDLGQRLSSLAPRLTDPAIIRLTACLSALGGERQLPLALGALQGLPGRETVRLQADVTPSAQQRHMLTVVAVLRATPPPPGDPDTPSGEPLTAH